MNDRLEDLLEYFKNTCERDLRFLVTEYGAQHETGYSIFEGWPPILKEAQFPQSGLFLFISRYSWPNLVLDVAYGDRELIIEPMIYYFTIGKQFGPWEVVTAAAIPKAEEIGGAAWVGTIDFLRSSIERLTHAIQLHWSVLSNPEPEVIARALQQRDHRMLIELEEQRSRDRNSAIIRASDAFHKGNFAKAVEILLPFSEDNELPTSARKILEIGKRHAPKS